MTSVTQKIVWGNTFVIILASTVFYSSRLGRHNAYAFIPSTEPRDPRRVSEGISEGFFEGSSYLSAEMPFKTHSKVLQNALNNPSKPFQEGVETDDALGFPGLRNQFQAPGVLWQEMKVLSLRLKQKIDDSDVSKRG